MASPPPSGPPPIAVRWFHATDNPKADHSPFKVEPEHPPPVSIQTSAGAATSSGASTASKTKAPTQWTAFSYRDSSRIEEKYQAMLNAQPPLSPNECTVLVNEDLLYEVDVAKKEVYPVYWYGPTFHVQRGTWFVTPDNGTKFIPCDDNLSKQLEDGYKKFKPESPTSTTTGTASATMQQELQPTSSNHYKSRSGEASFFKWALFGPYMNSHVIYTEKRGAMIINSQAAWGTKVWRGWDEVEKKRGSVVSLESDPGPSNSAGSGLDLSNGAVPFPSGSDGNLSAKASKESLGGSGGEEGWKDDENVTQDRQIDHLVLVVHGVGQKLGERVDTVDFAKDCTTLRHAIMQSSKLYFTAPTATPTFPPSKEKPAPAPSSRKPVLPNMPEHGGVQVLPVQWRQKIEFGKRRDPKAKEETLGLSEEEKKAREEAEAERKEQEVHVDDITLEGVQSIRYLVSDIVLDVLLYMTPKYRQEMVNHVVDEMNRIYNAYMVRNPNFTGRVSLYGHSLGSLLAFDILCNQAYGDNEPLPQMSFQPPRMQSEMDLSDVMQANGDIEYKSLNFKVDKFFAVGSPVGLFLLLKGDKLVGRPHDRPSPVPSQGFRQLFTCLENLFRYNTTKEAYDGTITGIADLSSGIMKSGFNMFSGLFHVSPNPAAGVMNMGAVAGTGSASPAFGGTSANVVAACCSKSYYLKEGWKRKG
ncbi:hypothetical protein BDR26DRAFT_939779 [Obelidium mucronatum]|nr:hypothetical protein BDR26DRAFT_939779 [Obelidium mucronatum]